MSLKTMLRVGQRAPAFEVYAGDGTWTSLHDLIADRPLLALFIRSTTCSFCQDEMAKMAHRHGDLTDAGLGVTAIVCEPLGKVQLFARDVKLPYPLLADEKRGAARAFGVYKSLGFNSFRMAQPSAFIVDSSGVVRYAKLMTSLDDVPSIDDYVAVGRSLQPSQARNGHSAAQAS